MALQATKPDEDVVSQMWGQGFGPAAGLLPGVLDAKQSDPTKCVFRETVRSPGHKPRLI